MRRFLLVNAAALVALTGGRAADSLAAPAGGGSETPSTNAAANDRWRGAVPAFADALRKWRRESLPQGVVVLRGPIVVGLQETSAAQAQTLAESLGRELDATLNGEVRVVPMGSALSDDTGFDGVAYDLRASRLVGEAGRTGRIVLEVVNPRDGKVVLAVEQREGDGAAATHASPRPASVPNDNGRSSNPPIAQSPVQAREIAPADRVTRKSAAPSSSAPRRPLAVPAPAQDSSRVVLRLEHGVIYFSSPRLASGISVLREERQVLSNGQCRVRLGIVCRRRKAGISLRCEFYGASGEPAGSVRGVELDLREGRPTAVALVSRRPAESYVLFIKD